MEFLTLFIAVGIISLLAAMSPGPDFAVVTKNSLFGSRITGLYTAIGVGLGIFLHVTYSLVGIGVVISQSIVLFSVIKYIGALYLLYLGYQLLKAKREGQEVNQKNPTVNISAWAALREGFLTNALNPKATLFFLSVFTQVVEPQTPLFIQAALGTEVAVIVGLWFVALTLFITHSPIKHMFSKVHYYLMKVMGGALVLLGVKLAFETKN